MRSAGKIHARCPERIISCIGLELVLHDSAPTHPTVSVKEKKKASTAEALPVPTIPLRLLNALLLVLVLLLFSAIGAYLVLILLPTSAGVSSVTTTHRSLSH